MSKLYACGLDSPCVSADVATVGGVVLVGEGSARLVRVDLVPYSVNERIADSRVSDRR